MAELMSLLSKCKSMKYIYVFKISFRFIISFYKVWYTNYQNQLYYDLKERIIWQKCFIFIRASFCLEKFYVGTGKGGHGSKFEAKLQKGLIIVWFSLQRDAWVRGDIVTCHSEGVVLRKY